MLLLRTLAFAFVLVFGIGASAEAAPQMPEQVVQVIADDLG